MKPEGKTQVANPRQDRVRADAQFCERDASVLAVLQLRLAALRERSTIARDHPKEARLTIHEAQVITMAATGQGTADIGRLLFMSPATVADPRSSGG